MAKLERAKSSLEVLEWRYRCGSKKGAGRGPRSGSTAKLSREFAEYIGDALLDA
jgi:hypothetical protein